MIIEYISLIYSERQNRTGESSIRSYLISILIEYDISLRVGISEHIEDIFLIFERPIEDTCESRYSFSYFLHTDSTFSCGSYSSIEISCCREFISSLFEDSLMFSDPISWIGYPE